MKKIQKIMVMMMKKMIAFLGLAAVLLFVGVFVQDTRTASHPQTSSAYNVRDYGAKGDGAADDTEAFEDAIEAADAAGGGEVYVPAGTYMLYPIYLESNVDLTGEDRDSVTLKLSDNAENQDLTRLVNVADAENIEIRNLTFDGNYEEHRGGTEHMHTLFIWDSKNIVVNNNRMQNAVGDGISVTGSTEASENVTVSNNIFLDNHRSNIVVEQVHDIKIFNNTSTSTIKRPALHFEPFEEINLYGAEIYDNTFESNATETYTIQIEGTPEAGNYFHDIKFYNNTITGETGRFMIKETKNAHLYNNQFSVKDFFIWFKNDSLQIYDNTIETTGGIILQGHLGDSINTQITNNEVTTQKNGITIKTSSEGTTFAENTFTGTGSGQAAHLWASGDDITDTTFENNTFTNFEIGITTDTYQGHVVDGVEVHGNRFENIEEFSVYAPEESSQNIEVGENEYINAGEVYVEE